MLRKEDKVAVLVGKPLNRSATLEAEVRARAIEQPFLGAILRHAEIHRWQVLPLASPDDAIENLTNSPGLGSQSVFIFLDSECFTTEIAPHVRQLCGMRQHVRLVVYAKTKEDDGVLEVDCLRAGARDFVVRGLPAKTIEGRLVEAIGARERNRSYQEIEPFGAREYIFVITPFGHKQNRDYESAISYGLSELGIPHIRGDDIRTPGDLMTKLEDAITQSRLVIANITSYEGKDNPNVF